MKLRSSPYDSSPLPSRAESHPSRPPFSCSFAGALLCSKRKPRGFFLRADGAWDPPTPVAVVTVTANCEAGGGGGGGSSMSPALRPLPGDLTAAQTRSSFGTCQERRIFPFFHAPDRLGNEYVPVIGDPSLGPGAYNHAERNNIVYHLAHRPESIKGYAIGARTAPRFALSDKYVSPSPTAYQTLLTKDQKIQPKYPAFSRKSPRFSQQVLEAELFPGPGTYDPYKMPHRHVTWPGKFGSPDWSLVPAPAKRTLKAELITDKAFRKQRNLLAYLSLYYSA